MEQSVKRNFTQLSKMISYILRHKPWLYNLTLDNEGWVSIEEMLLILHVEKTEWHGLSEINLVNMISKSSKQRHEIKNGKIRALYGHSIPNKLVKSLVEPPNILYHGTSYDSVKHISKEGLKPMCRHYIHLSTNVEMAREVAFRKSKNIKILMILAKEAYKNGVSFYVGNQQVWLADDIPWKHIKTDLLYQNFH